MHISCLVHGKEVSVPFGIILESKLKRKISSLHGKKVDLHDDHEIDLTDGVQVTNFSALAHGSCNAMHVMSFHSETNL